MAAARLAGLSAAAEEAATGDRVLWCQREPRSEVFGGGPPGHVGADFGEQAQRVVGTDTVDLREVRAGELMEGRAEIKPRFVLAGLVATAGGRE